MDEIKKPAMTKQDRKLWEIYEQEIADVFKHCFPNYKLTHNERIMGKFSEVERQIDISLRSSEEGFDFIGVVECKYYKEKVDVPVIDSFLGFLDDVQADFGYVVTNEGFSPAAQNRARAKAHLYIVPLNRVQEYIVDIDLLINDKISLLACNEIVFRERQKQRSHYVDLNMTSFSSQTISFKQGFVNTPYFAHKKLLEESARVFRDFPCLPEIKIVIPLGETVYSTHLKITQLEAFLGTNFLILQSDIKKWRAFLNTINKALVQRFAQEFIS